MQIRNTIVLSLSFLVFSNAIENYNMIRFSEKECCSRLLTCDMERVDWSTNRINQTLQELLNVAKENAKELIKWAEQKKSKTDEWFMGKNLDKQDLPMDCLDVFTSFTKSPSGVYVILPYNAKNEFSVYCDMDLFGGGWTYILNRYDGRIDFNRNWTEYKNGFGNSESEHWLGLEKIYELTNAHGRSNEILAEMVFWDATKHVLRFPHFTVGNETTGYNIEEVVNNNDRPGDTYVRPIPFSTFDRDQDLEIDTNCAAETLGGWWFGNCSMSNPTGHYLIDEETINDHKFTFYNLGKSALIKEVRLMVRETGQHLQLQTS